MIRGKGEGGGGGVAEEDSGLHTRVATPFRPPDAKGGDKEEAKKKERKKTVVLSDVPRVYVRALDLGAV